MAIRSLTYLTLATVLVPACLGQNHHDHKRNDDVSVSSLETLVQQQAVVIQTLQTKVSALENNVHANSHDIASLKLKHPKPVAFTVRFSKDCTNHTCGLPLSPHATLIFDHVVTNIGNGYNTRTGIFTAPVGGVYSFFLTEMSASTASQHSLYLAIVKEGAVLDYVYAEGSDSNEEGSSQVTTHLAAGQQVWVRQNGGDAVRGGLFTVFTGFLFQAD